MNEKKNKISACLVVYNEERVIEKCLSSIKNLADEIILVHDGECSDNTIQIAKKYTDKIYIRKHMGSMECHLSFAMYLARCEWLLRIDADEYFDNENIEKIKRLVLNSSVDAYSFNWEIWNGKKATHYKGLEKICLFRKDKYKFFGVPNEPGKIDGYIGKSDIILRHRPSYDHVSFKIFWKRTKKFAPINARYYFPDLVKYECFNTNQDEWVKYTDHTRKSAFLYMFYWPMRILLGQLKKAPWKNFIAANLALQQISYYFVLYLEVWKMKKKLK